MTAHGRGPRRALLALCLVALMTATARSVDHPSPAEPKPAAGGDRDGSHAEVPVRDPAPDGQDAVPCLDPPSETEVWEKIPKMGGSPPFLETQRNNVRFLVEKIGEKVDPRKVYPLAGPCQLVHCHYKCTVKFDEESWTDYPIPYHHLDHRTEVVYIDKDYLRRCPKSADGHEKDQDRLARQMRTIDRLIQELETLKAELRP